MSDTKSKAASPPPTGKTLATMAGGAQIQAIVPSTLGECFALAEMMFKTGLSIPRDVDSPQKLTMIYLKGMEVGLPPMASMECLGIINGKVCLHSDGIPALLWSRGFKIKEHYTGDRSKIDTCEAHCKITRPEGDEYEFSYSADDAKENKLWDTREKDAKGNPNKSPWFRYQRRMLKMRCRGWLARDCASDVLKGIPIYEEQADIELGREEYREVKGRALAVPDDILPDEPATVAATVSEAESSQDEPIANIGLYLQRLGEQLQAAESQEVFDEIWEAHEQLVEAGRLSSDAQREAADLCVLYGKRFA